MGVSVDVSARNGREPRQTVSDNRRHRRRPTTGASRRGLVGHNAPRGIIAPATQPSALAVAVVGRRRGLVRKVEARLRTGRGKVRWRGQGVEKMTRWRRARLKARLARRAGSLRGAVGGQSLCVLFGGGRNQASNSPSEDL